MSSSDRTTEQSDLCPRCRRYAEWIEIGHILAERRHNLPEFDPKYGQHAHLQIRFDPHRHLWEARPDLYLGEDSVRSANIIGLSKAGWYDMGIILLAASYTSHVQASRATELEVEQRQTVQRVAKEGLYHYKSRIYAENVEVSPEWLDEPERVDFLLDWVGELKTLRCKADGYG